MYIMRFLSVFKPHAHAHTNVVHTHNGPCAYFRTRGFRSGGNGKNGALFIRNGNHKFLRARVHKQTTNTHRI